MTRLRRLTGLHSPVTPRDERPAVDVVRAPHVVAGLHAATVLILGLAAVSWSSERLVSRHIYDLARSRYAQKDLGLVVQKVALRHSDVLPLYGSSEIDRDSAYHARELFADAPTGFSVLTVAGPGTPVFETLENLIALGRDLRGKKVVVSLSPPMFLLQNGAELDGRYAGNFSPLHALRLVLSRDVSFRLRRQLAARLVSRPFTVARNGVLEATANIVARDSPKSRILFLALLPLALVQVEFLEAQDKLLVLTHIIRTRESTSGPRGRAVRSLDWADLVADATAQVQPSANNPFGVHDAWWRTHQAWTSAQRNAMSDEAFLRDMSLSETWIDLEQLLQALNELGARPLILSMPFHGPFMDYMGVSAASRLQYYERVREIASRHGVRSAVLDDHENDRYFFFDLYSHLSPKGWVYYDQVLDTFYHDALR